MLDADTLFLKGVILAWLQLVMLAMQCTTEQQQNDNTSPAIGSETAVGRRGRSERGGQLADGHDDGGDAMRMRWLCRLAGKRASSPPH